MKTARIRFLTALALLAAALFVAPGRPAGGTGMSGSEFRGGGFDELRIEKEKKYNVPPDLTEQVWQFMKTRYLDSDAFIRGISPELRAGTGSETFVDIYYDTPSLTLLKASQGIRRRIRIKAGETTPDKELIQIKLSGDGNDTESRFELKYPVTKTLDNRPRPLVDTIGKEYRQAFVEALRSRGINPIGLRRIVAVRQTRRRVYLYDSLNSPLITVTLDQVSSDRFLKHIAFTEIEMELNEIAYTNGDPARRALLRAVNEKIASDLSAAFPQIRKDQVPKYNKVFSHFEARIPLFRLLVTWGPHLAFVLLLAGVALAVTLKRRTARKKP